MTPRQTKLFREIYLWNQRFPQGPFLVDGPIRMKLAKQMADAGWLDDHGPIGLGKPWGNAYRVNNAGVAAYNRSITGTNGNDNAKTESHQDHSA